MPDRAPWQSRSVPAPFESLLLKFGEVYRPQYSSTPPVQSWRNVPVPVGASCAAPRGRPRGRNARLPSKTTMPEWRGPSSAHPTRAATRGRPYRLRSLRGIPYQTDTVSSVYHRNTTSSVFLRIVHYPDAAACSWPAGVPGHSAFQTEAAQAVPTPFD